MQLRAALAEQDGQQHAGDDQRHAGDCLGGQRLAEQQPAEDRRDRRVEREQDAGTARADTVQRGKQQRVADEDADEAGGESGGALAASSSRQEPVAST